jgi:hypothetical protein
MDFRVSEYESSVAMSREDDLSSILASTETLLKALEECSDEEDELPITIFKVLFYITQYTIETVALNFHSKKKDRVSTR